MILVYRAVKRDKVYPQKNVNKRKFSVEIKRGNLKKWRKQTVLMGRSFNEKYGEL
jgi:hypothetical protein